MRSITVLGCTGSVGRQALEVIEASDELRVGDLAASSSWREVVGVAERHGATRIAIADRDAARQARSVFAGEVLDGPDACVELAGSGDADLVLNAIMGAAGLRSTIAAIESGTTLALANKESLVTGGDIVMPLARECGVEVMPIDSEHTALHQLISGAGRSEVRRLTITASGGPFRGMAAEQFADATAEDALAHPVWSMGGKITIDSATLMNKGLEVIEAHHLFGVAYEDIDVLVHPGSLIHGLVTLSDGAMLAHLGLPDMRVTIAYALHHPRHIDVGTPAPDLPSAGPLIFEPVDHGAFPCLQIAIDAAKTGGTAPCIMNAANEVAVNSFLAGQLRFGDIPRLVDWTLQQLPSQPVGDLDRLLQIDQHARRTAQSWLTSTPR